MRGGWRVQCYKFGADLELDADDELDFTNFALTGSLIVWLRENLILSKKEGVVVLVVGFYNVSPKCIAHRTMSWMSMKLLGAPKGAMSAIGFQFGSPG